jgi:hypothetical protein
MGRDALTRETEEVRQRLREVTNQAPDGANRAIAKLANLSPGTVSKFRRGIYLGDNTAVAERIGEALANMDAAAAITNGDWRAAWLVKRGRNVRLVRKRDTMESMRSENPDVHVVQIWIGPGTSELCFTEEGK